MFSGQPAGLCRESLQLSNIQSTLRENPMSNILSDDTIRSLVISYNLLGTREFFVIHHTNCGMEFFTSHPLVPRSIPVYGYIYDVKSGKLIEVEAATKAGAAS
jgi:carbonic anhydrase